MDDRRKARVLELFKEKQAGMTGAVLALISNAVKAAPSVASSAAGAGLAGLALGTGGALTGLANYRGAVKRSKGLLQAARHSAKIRDVRSLKNILGEAKRTRDVMKADMMPKALGTTLLAALALPLGIAGGVSVGPLTALGIPAAGLASLIGQGMGRRAMSKSVTRVTDLLGGARKASLLDIIKNKSIPAQALA